MVIDVVTSDNPSEIVEVRTLETGTEMSEELEEGSLEDTVKGI